MLLKVRYGYLWLLTQDLWLVGSHSTLLRVYYIQTQLLEVNETLQKN